MKVNQESPRKQPFNFIILIVFFISGSNNVHLFHHYVEFDPRIVGLTGPVSAVRQMTQEYRVFFKKVDEEGDDYLVDSSDNM